MRTFRTSLIIAAVVALAPQLCLSKPRVQTDPEKTRSQYISRIQQQNVPAPTEQSVGSLWFAGGALTDIATDYKAHRLNDVINVVVVQTTTAQASGDVSSERSVDTTSGISGVAGRVNTGGINPLLAAQSSTTLKGKGSSNASSLLRTNLAGRVIAVLHNENLVVEAERSIAVNNQKETMIVRGVLRPGDVAPDNSVPSSALSNLDIELKGKGIISDATRPINPLLRKLLWLIGF